jgi:hypothetical protein
LRREIRDVGGICRPREPDHRHAVTTFQQNAAAPMRTAVQRARLKTG